MLGDKIGEERTICLIKIKFIDNQREVVVFVQVVYIIIPDVDYGL